MRQRHIGFVPDEIAFGVIVLTVVLLLASAVKAVTVLLPQFTLLQLGIATAAAVAAAAALAGLLVLVRGAYALLSMVRGSRLGRLLLPPPRFVQVSPCSGWVARYSEGQRYRDIPRDEEGLCRRPVAAWAVTSAGDVVGLTTDYERTSIYGDPGNTRRYRPIRPPQPRLVRCDALPDFIGYDQEGRR